ncbi:FmdB family zinc ribbon protein, partial [Myxococcota bacterium]
MPLHDFLCLECGETTESLIVNSEDVPECRSCGSGKLKKLLSAHSSLSGAASSRSPGSSDTACCGTTPAEAGCAGP